MPKKCTKTGKNILTAGEISTYSLCPESWRLQYIKHVQNLETKKIRKGQELHKKWSQELKEANFFTFGTRVVFYLIILASFSYLIPIIAK